MYRHGDVALDPIAPVGFAKDDWKPRKRITLAKGEVSGHAHVLTPGEGGALAIAEFNGERYVQVKDVPALLTHEEHGPLTIPVGAYRIIRQREASSNIERAVTTHYVLD